MSVQDGAASLQVRAKSAAASFLRKRGYKIIEQDWRCPEGGADIVAKSDGAFVFADVVSRDGNRPFEAESVVSAEKDSRIEAACAFMRERGEHSGDMRFDTVLVTFFGAERAILTRWTDGRINEGGGREGRTHRPLQPEGRDGR